jgi:alpha-ketoglutarate-dependent taurine dioxygenase
MALDRPRALRDRNAMTTADFRIADTDGPLGATVEGLDLAGDLGDAAMRQLMETLYRRRLLIFRDQDLDFDAYERFAARWGELFLEPYTNLAVEGHPGIISVGNTGGLLETAEFRNGAAFWHTDRAYAPDPNAVTMLYCVHAPAEGGETMFTDLIAAYAALDPKTRREIAGLVAAHRYGEGEREDWEFGVHPMREDQARQLPPPGRHAIARRHSVTGETVLYAPAGSWIEVEGLEREKASALMRRLKLHAIDERFVYRHRYRPGDLAMWDNTATLHCAAPIGPATDPSNRRLLHRIVATGLPPILAS